MSHSPANPATHTLRAGLALSVLMHAGVAGVFSWVGTHQLDSTANAGQFTQLDLFQAFRQEPPKPPVEPPPPPPPAPDPERIRLGLDESDAKTETWKGAAEATEHQAAKSEVNQPALAIAPGTPGPADAGASDSGSASAEAQMGPPVPTQPEAAAPAAPSPAAPASEPQPKAQQPEPRQDQPLQPEPQQPLPQQSDHQQLQPQQPLPAPEGPAAVEVGPQQFEPQQLLAQQPDPLQEKEQQTKPLQPLDQQPKPVQDAQPQDPSAPTPNQPQPQGAAGASAKNAPGAKANSPDAQPGTKAEEESAAASVVETLSYRPGQPLAGKGLQVRTVNPRWGVTTLLTSSPRNTVVRITFGRSGKVIKAAFTDSGTGYPDVDGPLLDAIYRWTATGELLKKIPPSDPRDPQKGLNFDIKIIMQHGAAP